MTQTLIYDCTIHQEIFALQTKKFLEAKKFPDVQHKKILIYS